MRIAAISRATTGPCWRANDSALTPLNSSDSLAVSAVFLSRVVKSLARPNTNERMAGCSRMAANRSWSTVATPRVFQGMERVRRPMR